MKRFIVVLITFVLCSTIGWGIAAEPPASLTTVSARRSHHATRHHAHKAGKHRRPKHHRTA